MDRELKKRIGRVALAVALFFFAGFSYAAFIKLTGWRIPCVFRLITGLKCPGCGITHSSVCFMHFDYAGMVRYNLFAPAILVFTGWVFAYTSLHYIKTGKYRLGTGCTPAEIIFLSSFVIWWVVRNIAGM